MNQHLKTERFSGKGRAARAERFAAGEQAEGHLAELHVFRQYVEVRVFTMEES